MIHRSYNWAWLKPNCQCTLCSLSYIFQPYS